MPKRREVVFTCETCGFHGSSHQSFMYHSIAYHDIKVFACPFCDHVCKEKYKTFRHLRNQHQKVLPANTENKEILNYSAKAINAPAKSDQLLCYFERVSVDSYCCIFCNESLNNKSEFSSHLCTHHNPSHFIVNELKLHLNKVLDKKPFVCKLCGSASCSIQLLSEHILSSHPFNVLSEKVDFSTFATPYNKLHRHSKSHKHRCPHCLFSSFFSKNLKKHLCQHGADMKFKCSLCNFSSDFEMTLTKHKRYFHPKPTSHFGHQHTKCSVCKEKTYFSRKAFMNHWRRKHRDMSEPPVLPHILQSNHNHANESQRT